MISNWLIAFFLLSGSVFLLIASLGVLRFPDIYSRMQAISMAPGMGFLLLLTGVCIHFGQLWVIIESVFIMLFIFLTMPIASHMIGSAAHLLKSPKWKKDMPDDLEKSRNNPGISD